MQRFNNDELDRQISDQQVKDDFEEETREDQNKKFLALLDHWASSFGVEDDAMDFLKDKVDDL